MRENERTVNVVLMVSVITKIVQLRVLKSVKVQMTQKLQMHAMYIHVDIFCYLLYRQFKYGTKYANKHGQERKVEVESDVGTK